MVVVQKDHAAFCFDHLITHFDKDAQLQLLTQDTQSVPHADKQFPLFVTWTRRDTGLRGCIGTFRPHQLSKGLASFALNSALRDSRFDPVRLSELPMLECAVSILTDFEQADHLFDWQVGVHGITIDFSHGSSRFSATYLPEVASEQGWDREQTLDSLCRKAGYRGAIKAIQNSISVTRYQSEKNQARLARVSRNAPGTCY